jgi:hypothetical protein
MQTIVTGWQLEIFGGETAIVKAPPKPDPLPDPQYWSESIVNQMVDALISLASDSRRGDSMPESLMDCCALLRDRLKPKSKLKFEFEDYQATLGWVMGLWDGALPYSYVCRVNGIDPETIQDVILTTPLLKRDWEELRRGHLGTLL